MHTIRSRRSRVSQSTIAVTKPHRHFRPNAPRLQRALGFRIIAARSHGVRRARETKRAGLRIRIVFPALTTRMFGEDVRLRISAKETRAARRTSVPRVAVVTIAGAFAALGAIARAQVPAPPPGPPPLTRPSVPVLPGAPSQLISVPGVVATPLLTPVPIPTASPTPAPRSFNCSCYTTTSGVEWSGTVAAPGYAAARSAASAACISYVTSAPQSPFIPPGQSPGLSNGTTASESAVPSAATSNTTGPPGTTISNSPVNALKSSPSLTGATFCNVCACN